MGIDLTGCMDEGMLKEEADFLNKVQQAYATTTLEDNGLHMPHTALNPLS